ncbi:type II toxin-antitoxin system PemK/MazF family toxin [Umezawaea sp. Da 62-37]|uniref:type II toxin-antitoxin system PemK/MazF family toxin n=1 Tax=Umezawaea sp. Da 62-37 TaxID=3075927 RepID=UPI0028F6E771|nr:type II toxin-antitoxin system PemK/MazF family toxin [Umezawaea sp. Da 62-37]WNV88396.1 type II toxin-antitoxin system PemK/MazF family toxin [Umezawaea sp. Da 62-37]
MTLLYAVVLVAVAAAVVAGVLYARRTPKPGELQASAPDESWLSRPQPGDIWWADVPFREGTGGKVRPCVVLRTYRKRVDVLRITSQDKSDRADHLRIPTKGWDPKATHDSYVDLSAPFRLNDRAFNRKAGRMSAAAWSSVREQHPTGWAA